MRDPSLSRGAVAKFAARPVSALAGVVALLLVITSPWYGYFGDELYFIAAGRHPSWGYADQPPLLPLLAAGLDRLAPGSLVVLRLPAALMTASTVVLAALVARELGGRAHAQVAAAAATAISPYLLATGHLLATSTVDPFLWSVLLWLLVRWVRTDRDGRADDRLLLTAGAVTAIALLTKLLVVALLVGLAVGLLICGPRHLWRRPCLWAGIAVALAAMVPTVAWQAPRGWPQLEMSAVVAGEAAMYGNRWQFVPVALFFAGLVPGVALLTAGLVGLLRRPELASWRFTGIAAVTATAAFVAAGGRPYYVAGCYALLFAAGAVTLQHRFDERGVRDGWAWTVAPSTFVISGVLVGLAVLPVGPAAPRAALDHRVAGQIGWSELADSVTAAHRSLPPEVRADTVIVASAYWYAAAIERERTSRGLPAVSSPHRGYGYLAVPPGASRALLVGNVAGADQLCHLRQPLPPHVTTTPSAVNGFVPITLCSPTAPWSQLWPSLQTMP